LLLLRGDVLLIGGFIGDGRLVMIRIFIKRRGYISYPLCFLFKFVILVNPGSLVENDTAYARQRLALSEVLFITTFTCQTPQFDES
jgi:hypothetical protein